MFKRQALRAKSRIPAVGPDLGAPEKPNFSVIMFMAVATKDLILDPIVFGLTLSSAAITGIIATVPLLGPMVVPVVGSSLGALGWMLGVMISFVFAFILGLWFIFKPSLIQRLMWKRFIIGVIAATFVGFIPGMRFIIPEFMILVYLLYLFEKKAFSKMAQAS